MREWRPRLQATLLQAMLAPVARRATAMPRRTVKVRLACVRGRLLTRGLAG
jgi:hypothetical protein